MANIELKLPNVVLSYPHVFAPRSVMGGAPKFSATAIMDIKTHAATIQQIAQAKKDLIKSEFNDVAPPRPLPFRTGEDRYPGNSSYVGKVVLNANANEEDRPFVVNHARQEIVDPSAVYPGCIVNMWVQMYAYKMQGSSGLTFGLTGIQFVDHGERLDNRPKMEDLVEDIPPPSIEDFGAPDTASIDDLI